MMNQTLVWHSKNYILERYKNNTITSNDLECFIENVNSGMLKQLKYIYIYIYISYLILSYIYIN